MTKITIFSGFLGAGKTTLIKKLIADGFRGEKLVLIENEFGEIGIDGGFMKDAGIEVTEMNSGCICCSLVGDFGKALAQVLEQYHPDRILIEPSGVGKLSDVIRAVQKLEGDVTLAGFVTVADAARCKTYMKNFGEFYNDQISHASAILLSRTSGMDEDKLAAVVALLREKNPDAPIVTTPWDELTGAQIIDAMERRNTLAAALELLSHEHEHHHHAHDHEHCHHDHEGEHERCHHDHEGEHAHCHHEHEGEHEHCHHKHEGEHAHCHHDHHHEHEHPADCTCGCHDHHHHDHDADEVFTSFGAETARKYTADEITACLTALDSGEYGDILRAKGILPAQDGGWLHFDYVPNEQDVRAGAADVTGRLCVIGAQLREDALRTLFRIG